MIHSPGPPVTLSKAPERLMLNESSRIDDGYIFVKCGYEKSSQAYDGEKIGSRHRSGSIGVPKSLAEAWPRTSLAENVLAEDGLGRRRPWPKTSLAEDGLGRRRPWPKMSWPKMSWPKASLAEDVLGRSRPWPKTSLAEAVLGRSRPGRRGPWPKPSSGVYFLKPLIGI
jgi:hypothetical protein